MAPTDWFSTIVCPLFGMILANIMWCSPMKAVLQARETRSIGSLNSIPFVATITNCIGWMLYGCLKKDAFLFFANVFGIVLGMFYTINCLTLTTKKPEEASFSKDYLITESLLLFSVFFWCLMGLFCAMLFNSFNDPVAQAANLVGYVSVTFSISYYAAPLSTVFQVIATHDASSLYLPTISINFINGCCWFFYGLIGTHDIILWGPNGLGILLSCFQISLIIMFRKQSIASLFSLRGDEQQQLISKEDFSEDGFKSNDLQSKSSKIDVSNKQKGHIKVPISPDEFFTDPDEEEMLDMMQDTDSRRWKSGAKNPLH